MSNPGRRYADDDLEQWHRDDMAANDADFYPEEGDDE